MRFKPDSMTLRRVACFGLAVTIAALQPMQFAMAAKVGVLLAHGIRDDGRGMEELALSIRRETQAPIKLNSYTWDDKLLVDQANEVQNVLSGVTLKRDDPKETAKYKNKLTGIEEIKTKTPSEFLNKENWFDANSNAVDKILLAGHSQGGLRLRQYLQQVASPTAQNKVAGLITFGTPHKGAAIANNGNGVASSITLGVLGPLAIYNPGVGIVAAIPILGFVNQQVQNFGGRAFDEMKVDSDFVNRLNNKVTKSCGWSVRNEWRQGWFGIWYVVQHWTQTCVENSYPGYKEIPRNVILKAVIGQDNEIDNMIGDTGFNLKGARIALGIWSGALAAMFVAAAIIQWWTAWWFLPAAAMMYNAAAICFDLPNIWKRAVGSWSGDGFMTEDSQDFLSLNVGGNRGDIVRISNAHHAGNTHGEVNEFKTAQLIIGTQKDLAR
jgi:triacylglycerol esterase/lipase EstA (alpha/beta hydrolase family)